MNEIEAIEMIDLMAKESLQPHFNDKWILIRSELIKKRDIQLLNDLITVDYLLRVHPEITTIEAMSLLVFSKSKTIKLQGCYGDGSIIFPLWKKAVGKC